MVMNSPRFAGRDVAPGIDPAGAAKAVVLAIWIAPCPLPEESMVKIPGPEAPRLSVTAGLGPAPFVTITDADDLPCASHGKTRLICDAETKKSGARVPLTVTLTPPSDVGKGRVVAAIVCEARLAPNNDAIPPA